MTVEKIQAKIEKLEQRYRDAEEYLGVWSPECANIERQINELETRLNIELAKTNHPAAP